MTNFLEYLPVLRKILSEYEKNGNVPATTFFTRGEALIKGPASAGRATLAAATGWNRWFFSIFFFKVYFIYVFFLKNDLTLFQKTRFSSQLVVAALIDFFFLFSLYCMWQQTTVNGRILSPPCTPPPLTFLVFELRRWPGYQSCSKVFKVS